MDVNLTGEIAANFVESLNPHWYTFITAAAVVVGGVMTGIITLIGIYITNKNAEKREERNRQEENTIRRREELKTFYKDVTLKKIELYSQIRGLKPTLHDSLSNSLLEFISSLRYLAYVQIDDQEEPKDSNEKFGKLARRNLLLETQKKHGENKLLHERMFLENFTTISEKLGLSIIMFEKNNNELKDLIRSFEFIMETEHDIAIIEIGMVYDNQEKNTYEEVDRIVDELIKKVPPTSAQKIMMALDKILLYMENEIRTETPWWKIDQW